MMFLLTGFQISSDLDTDTEIEIPMGKKPGNEEKDDDFFDFYE